MKVDKLIREFILVGGFNIDEDLEDDLKSESFYKDERLDQ